jgi:hypothetical protein
MVITEAYLSVINYIENFLFLFASSISYTDGIVGIISLDFNVLDQLLIKYFTFVVHLRRSGNMMWLYISCLYTYKKPISLCNSAGLKVHPYQPWLHPEPEQ